MADDLAPLSDAQKVRLLRLARQAMFQFVSRGRISPVEEDDERLQQPDGAFCSLHIGDRLRGCIGTFAGREPLYRKVLDVTVGASARDPRFAPVRMDEVPRIDIEISVLGPMRQIDSPDQIVLGRDGLLVSMDRVRGTLLPQVATQFDWTVEQFLTQTCVKAGMAEDAWQQPECRIEAFATEVFSESAMRQR